jgi:hypothetical protein
LDNKRFDECSEGEERLVRKQGKDEANEPHIREAIRLMSDGTPCGGEGGGGVVPALYMPTWQPLPCVESGAWSACIRTQVFDRSQGEMISINPCETKNRAQTHVNNNVYL